MDDILDSLLNELAGEDGLFIKMMRDTYPQHYRQTMAIFSLRAHWYAHLADTVKCPLDVVLHLLAVEIYTQDSTTGVAKECAKTKPQPWLSLKPLWARCRHILDSLCSVLVKGTKSVQFVHKTAQDFFTDKNVWHRLFSKAKPQTNEGCTLAFLEAAVQRAKCCQEIVTDWTELSGHYDPKFSDQCPLLGFVISVLAQHPPVKDISRCERTIDSLDVAGAHLVSALSPGLRGRPWIASYFTYEGFCSSYYHPYLFRTMYDVAFSNDIVWYLKLKKRDKRFDKDALHHPLTLHPEIVYPKLDMAKKLGLSVNYGFARLYNKAETPWTLLLSNLSFFFKGGQFL